MITRDKVKSIREKLMKAFESIGEEENVTIIFGSNIKFTDAEINTNIKVRTNQLTEVSDDNNSNMCKQVGFECNVIGMEFKDNGYTYKIVDIRKRNRKYPVIVKRSDDKLYKYSVSSATKLLGGKSEIKRKSRLNTLLIK